MRWLNQFFRIDELIFRRLRRMEKHMAQIDDDIAAFNASVGELSAAVDKAKADIATLQGEVASGDANADAAIVAAKGIVDGLTASLAAVALPTA